MSAPVVVAAWASFATALPTLQTTRAVAAGHQLLLLCGGNATAGVTIESVSDPSSATEQPNVWTTRYNGVDIGGGQYSTWSLFAIDTRLGADLPAGSRLQAEFSSTQYLYYSALLDLGEMTFRAVGDGAGSPYQGPQNVTVPAALGDTAIGWGLTYSPLGWPPVGFVDIGLPKTTSSYSGYAAYQSNVPGSVNYSIDSEYTTVVNGIAYAPPPAPNWIARAQSY